MPVGVPEPLASATVMVKVSATLTAGVALAGVTVVVVAICPAEVPALTGHFDRQIVQIHRTQPGDFVIAGAGRESGGGAAIGGAGGAVVVAGGHVVKCRGIGRAVGRELVEGGIDESLSGCISGLLIDEGEHAGEDGGSETGAAGDGQIVGRRIAEAAIATGLLGRVRTGSRRPVGGVAGAVEVSGVDGRRIQRDVGNKALGAGRDARERRFANSAG